MTHLGNERGGVSAEFAITLPAMLLIIGVVIGAIFLTGTRVTLVSAAHDIARLEARGDTLLASARSQELPTGTRVARTEQAGIYCVTLTANPGRGVLQRLHISGHGCAAVSHRSS